MSKFRMKKSDHDHLMFYKLLDLGYIILVVYVNDIMIARSDKLKILKLKNFLPIKFQTKDVEALMYYLGIEIA